MNTRPLLTPFTVCVYCGSREGADPAHATAARAVGQHIGKRRWRLVYGGAQVGLMGVLADAALAAGAEVVGVIPRSLMAREVGHAGLTELQVVETMHQRKQAMAERADAFLALPGGIGSFEELFEAWTWRQLGYHDKPVGILNVAGYYAGLLDFLAHSVREGFMGEWQMGLIRAGGEATVLLEALVEEAGRHPRGDKLAEVL